MDDEAADYGTPQRLSVGSRTQELNSACVQAVLVRAPVLGYCFWFGMPLPPERLFFGSACWTTKCMTGAVAKYFLMGPKRKSLTRCDGTVPTW